MAELVVRPFQTEDLWSFTAQPQQLLEQDRARLAVGSPAAPYVLGEAITLECACRIAAVGGAWSHEIGGRPVLIAWALVADDLTARERLAIIRHAARVLATATVRVLITVQKGFQAAATTARHLGFQLAPHVDAPHGYQTWERLP